MTVALNDKAPITKFWLALTYGCNNRCAGCYAQKSGFLGEPMPLDDALFLSGIMRDLGVFDCLLIGGEPTLYRNLIPLIRRGSELGLTYTLVTNGRRLHQRRFVDELVAAGLWHVSISIEGVVAATHNATTRAISYRQTAAAIRHCLSLDLSFNTVFTISRQNFGEVISLGKMLSDIGVENILYNVGVPAAGSDGGDAANAFALQPTQAAQVIEEAFLEFKRSGIRAQFFAAVPLCVFNPTILHEMFYENSILNGPLCQIFYGSGVAFEPNGNVLPCTHFVRHPLFNWKTMHIQSPEAFARAWYGDEGIHGRFAEALWSYPHPNCEHCDYWGRCVGGCPFLWTHFSPENYIGKEVRSP